MSKRQKMERKALCSKIQEYFDSPDKEMWKLGRQMCHQYRINYWVECIPYAFNTNFKFGLLKRLSKISIKSIPGKRWNFGIPHYRGHMPGFAAMAIYDGPSISYQIILNGYKKAKRKRKRVFQEQRSRDASFRKKTVS